ncbi:MAG: BrnT family toxin [Hassallia sp.]
MSKYSGKDLDKEFSKDSPTLIPTANNEQRDFIIGYSLSQRLLLVVYVERVKRSRIISARPATRTERKLYEES